jgi:hypothetical protein
MSYPLLTEVVDLTRSLLLLDAPGAEAVYPSTRIVKMIGMAWREMWDAMVQADLPRPRQTFYHLLPSYTSVFFPESAGVSGFSDPLMVEEMAPSGSPLTVSAITAYTNGALNLTTPTHSLTSGARVIAVGINEDGNGDFFATIPDNTHVVLNGTVERGAPIKVGQAMIVIPSDPTLVSFSKVNPVSSWTRKAPAATLREYQWEGDRFKFHGATADRILSITGYLSAPPAPEAETDVLRVDNCHNFIAYRAAALLAGAQGRDDLFTRYTVMAIGASQKPDGSGGFLAGLTGSKAKAGSRTQAARPV